MSAVTHLPEQGGIMRLPGDVTSVLMKKLDDMGSARSLAYTCHRFYTEYRRLRHGKRDERIKRRQERIKAFEERRKGRRDMVNIYRKRTVAEKVFEAPKLLASILSQLPQRDLLVSMQRLNKTTRRFVIETPELQRKLFFGGDASAPADDIASQALARGKNPLLRGRFWVHLQDALRSGFRLPSRDQSAKEASVGYNELARFYPLDPMMHPLASWHRMLTHQLPLRGVGYVIEVVSEDTSVRCGITGVNGDQDKPLDLPEVRVEDIVRVCEDQYDMKLMGGQSLAESQHNSHTYSVLDLEVIFTPLPGPVRQMQLTDAPGHTLEECDVVVKAVVGLNSGSMK